MFLISCNCCLHFFFLVQFSSSVLVSPLFCHILSHSKAEPNPALLRNFLLFSLSFSSCYWLSLAEGWRKLHWAVPSVSGECHTCTGKRCSPFEILFRTDCCFCKSLYMFKILVFSFLRSKRKNIKITSEKQKAFTQTGGGGKETKYNLQWKRLGERFFMRVVASNSSLPFSWSDP